MAEAGTDPLSDLTLGPLTAGASSRTLPGCSPLQASLLWASLPFPHSVEPARFLYHCHC